jgi:hypothetical protein
VLIDLAAGFATAGQAVWSEASAVGVRFHEELPKEQVADLAGREFIVASGEWIAA